MMESQKEGIGQKEEQDKKKWMDGYRKKEKIQWKVKNTLNTSEIIQ